MSSVAQAPGVVNFSDGSVPTISISHLNSDFFHKSFVVPGRPVLINEVFDEEWTLSWLEDKLGEYPVGARYYGAERFHLPKTQWKRYCETRTLPFPEFVKLLRDGTAARERIYVANCDVSSTPVVAAIQSQLSNLETRTGLKPNGVSNYSMWLGAPGHTEPLHFDLADGLLMNLRGTKHITLVPPSEAHNVYPFGFFDGGLSPGFSKVYLNQPDLKTYPRMASALKARQEVILGPRQALFLPIGWWHEVTTTGTDYVCSLNRFWRVEPFHRNFVNRYVANIYLVTQMAKPLAAFSGKEPKKPAAQKV